MKRFSALSLLLLLAFSWLVIVNSWRNVFGVDSEDVRPVKCKTFFLHTLNETRNVGSIATQHIFNSSMGENADFITSNMRIIARWFLYPELAESVRIEGFVNLTLWYKATGTLDGALWTLTLNELDKDGNVISIQQSSLDLPSDPSEFAETTISAFANHTLQRGSTLEVHINIKGNSATDYTIIWGNSTFDSRVVLPVKDYIRIVPASEGGIWTLNSELEAQSTFALDAENKTVYIRVKVTDPFGGYDIHDVKLSVRMPNGTLIPELSNVSATKISGYFNSFESLFQVVWNYEGYPEGRYNMTVYAIDNNGYLTFLSTGYYGIHLEIDESGVFFIGVPPLEIFIQVFDGDGQTLEGATVLVLLGDEVQFSGDTNSSGYVKVNLAPGSYQVEVWWLQTLVGHKGLLADRNWPAESPFNLSVQVYQVSFRALDVKGKSLERAAFTVRFPNGQTVDEPLIADEQGIVSLGKVPGGTYNVVVMWRGKIVADISILIDVSGINDVHCAVFYVNFKAADLDGEPVQNALITVLDSISSMVVDADLTNASGQLFHRLPVGFYKVSAEWFGVTVLDSYDIVVESNMGVSLTLSIYTVKMIPVDSREIVLENAVVVVSSGAFSQSGNTFSGGEVSFKLPCGNYLTKVYWQNIEVYSEDITLDGAQDTLRLSANVFYLTVQVCDKGGASLKDAHVTIKSDGVTISTSSTNVEGEAEFRLPVGTYRIEVFFKSIYHLTYFEDLEIADVNLDGDKSVSVIFSSFPIPFYTTTLFFILLTLFAVIAVIIILFLFKLRRVAK